MSIGLVGRKCGMTRIFTDFGESIPVTVIEALPNKVTMVKTDERDGYRAVQLTAGQARPGKLSKPQMGQFDMERLTRKVFETLREDEEGERMVTLDGRAVNGGLLGRLTRQLSEIKEGIGEVRRSKRIRPVVMLNMFTGLLFMGAVMVPMPLIIRDVYAGNSAEIATMNLALFGGIGISSAIISAAIGSFDIDTAPCLPD